MFPVALSTVCFFPSYTTSTSTLPSSRYHPNNCPPILHCSKIPRLSVCPSVKILLRKALHLSHLSLSPFKKQRKKQSLCVLEIQFHSRSEENRRKKKEIRLCTLPAKEQGKNEIKKKRTSLFSVWCQFVFVCDLNELLIYRYKHSVVCVIHTVL